MYQQALAAPHSRAHTALPAGSLLPAVWHREELPGSGREMKAVPPATGTPRITTVPGYAGSVCPIPS